MIPNPENPFSIPALIARATAAPPARGSRRAASTVPANMQEHFIARENAAWNHSPLAGALWELGLRSARAIALSDKKSNL